MLSTISSAGPRNDWETTAAGLPF